MSDTFEIGNATPDAGNIWDDPNSQDIRAPLLTPNPISANPRTHPNRYQPPKDSLKGLTRLTESEISTEQLALDFMIMIAQPKGTATPSKR